MEVSVDQLQRAIEGQHGGRAALVDALPVKEVFEGKTVCGKASSMSSI